MATYTTTKATLDEIAARSEQARKRLEQARATVDAVVVELGAMGSAYTAFIAQLDADATANSGNQAWQIAKAEKDQLVADFMALRTTALAMQTALS